MTKIVYFVFLVTLLFSVLFALTGHDGVSKKVLIISFFILILNYISLIKKL